MWRSRPPATRPGRRARRAATGEAKYRRLVALKDRFDPGNLFRRNANILPSASGPNQPQASG
jgi:Berberine and berberine like